MIKLDRRNIIIGSAAAAVAVLAGVQLFVVDFLGLSEKQTSVDSRAAGEVDLTQLGDPPANGENPLGAEDAKVTVIEYASASCPHCADFYRNVFPTLKKDYIDTGKIRFLFREFPHNDAALAAFMLARCAPKEKYHLLIDVFFTTQDKWLENPAEGLKNIAQQAGFTEESFKACINNKDVAKGILAERTRAEGFGVTGIPYIFINGVRYDGDNTIEGFKAKIDPLLG